MSVSPGLYNFVVQRRADFSLALEFKDGNDSPVNLLGSTVSAQVWDQPRSVKFADFAVTYTDRANGLTTISLTDTQTEILPDVVYYDVLVESPSGFKDYYLEGQITVSQGYTA